MDLIVSKTDTAIRRTTAFLMGEAVRIDCPAWCVLDHTDVDAGWLTDREDLFHTSAKVSLPSPEANEGAPSLDAYLLSWMCGDDKDAHTPLPCIAVSGGFVAVLTGDVQSLDVAEASALADEHDSDELRKLVAMLKVEQARHRRAASRSRRWSADQWSHFLRNVCGGCRVGTDAEPPRFPARKFVVRSALAPVSSYTHCACRGCMDTTVSGDASAPELCSDCEAAGCESGAGDCQRDDAYGD